MTQDKKEDLNAKFLRHSLTETERAELADAINTDSEFREAIRFDLGVAEAMERERYDRVEQERLATENSVRQWKRLVLAAIGILGIISLIYLFNSLRGKQNTEPFTPEEGLELMEGVIAKARSERRIGAVAGPDDWPAILAREPITREDLLFARSQLSSIAISKGICDDSEIAYFLGTLELYVVKDYGAANTALACLQNDPDFPFPNDVELPSILALIGTDQITAAATRMRDAGLSLSDLPSGASDMVIAQFKSISIGED